MCIDDPRLGEFERSVEEVPDARLDRKQMMLLTYLIAIFERAFFMYRDQSERFRRKQWSGWEACTRRVVRPAPVPPRPAPLRADVRYGLQRLPGRPGPRRPRRRRALGDGAGDADRLSRAILVSRSSRRRAGRAGCPAPASGRGAASASRPGPPAPASSRRRERWVRRSCRAPPLHARPDRRPGPGTASSESTQTKRVARSSWPGQVGPRRVRVRVEQVDRHQEAEGGDAGADGEAVVAQPEGEQQPAVGHGQPDDEGAHVEAGGGVDVVLHALPDHQALQGGGEHDQGQPDVRLHRALRA